jgi:hypothetical protein
MSEPLFKDDKNSDNDSDEPIKHDGFDIFGSILGKLNIWIAVLIFIIFILMNTSFFIEDVIKKINSDFVASDGNLTSNGIIIQGVFLSLAYIVVDLLVSGGIL